MELGFGRAGAGLPGSVRVAAAPLVLRVAPVFGPLPVLLLQAFTTHKQRGHLNHAVLNAAAQHANLFDLTLTVRIAPAMHHNVKAGVWAKFEETKKK